MKNYNEIWGFDFGGEIKTYGYSPKTVLAVLDEEGRKDFAAALAIKENGQGNPYTWAALQAGYHMTMVFLRRGLGEDSDEKIEDGAYFLEKLEILRAAGMK